MLGSLRSVLAVAVVAVVCLGAVAAPAEAMFATECLHFCVNNYSQTSEHTECAKYCKRVMEAPKCDCGHWMRWGSDNPQVCGAVCGFQHGVAPGAFAPQASAIKTYGNLYAMRARAAMLNEGAGHITLSRLAGAAKKLQSATAPCDKHTEKISAYICGYVSAATAKKK
jgi:hypothetical protein